MNAKRVAVLMMSRAVNMRGATSAPNVNQFGKQEQMKMSITKKIAQVILELGKFQADKRNEQQRYDYISADAVLSRVGTAMASAGLVIIPTVSAESAETIEYTDSYGKAKSRIEAVVEFDMMIMDGESQPFTARWVGRGTDYSATDKALYKAYTSGHKYFLMKLFCIGIGNEDGEHDEQDTPAPPPAKKQAKPQAPAPTKKPSDEAMKAFHALGVEVYGDNWDTKRAELVKAITKNRSESSKHLTEDEYNRLMAGMESARVGIN